MDGIMYGAFPANGAQSGMGLPPRARLLDVRLESDALCRPVADSVNIPLRDLNRRVFELPSPRLPILVADTGPEAAEALGLLMSLGRQAELEPHLVQADAPVLARLWDPNPYLLEKLPVLPPGLAVDLGCGSGRDAVALAAHGWRVVAIDRLPEALEMGRQLAARYLGPDAASRIEWRMHDLEAERPDLGAAPDLGTMFFFLDRRLLAWLAAEVAPGGSLLVQTFTELHRERHGRPRREHLVLKTGELPTLAPGMETVEHREEWIGDRHLGSLWARNGSGGGL
jgi:SAM-dependent methyltransferase